MKSLALLLLLVAACAFPALADPSAPSAQLVGTVHEGRWRWNPYSKTNDMQPDPEGGYTVRVLLDAAGGRNGDGIYAMRFFTGRNLRSVYKRSEPGKLVTGPASASAGNIVFRVPTTREYWIHFDPAKKTYSITPTVEEITKIDSMQINGFVHDAQGSTECFDGRRTRPAEKWDEWSPSHEFSRQPDGSWTITLPLSASGGHEKNGVYQCLLSANNNSDWGYSAILGKPGRLAGGNGYDSRVGHIEETAITFLVKKDGNYTITVRPDDYRFDISPPVEFFDKIEFQVDGDVVPDPWNPRAESHDMEKGEDGLWRKKLTLKKAGPETGGGHYTMNFSIDGDWALDSIGFGGEWGQTWHSAPQEWNLLFRVPDDGDYTVTLDPASGRFWFDVPVEPLTAIKSLQIMGDFEDFSGDGKGGWNPLDPMHDMETTDGVHFTKDLQLKAGKTYTYKHTANRVGWAWSLVDYPYDGYRRLAPHGNPAPLRFECPRDGDYRFNANVETGDYGVFLLKHR